ncbi:MAG: S1 RNA-binding domain-containing protein, partial [Myxococcales bacterium]
PWEQVADKYPEGTKVHGKVRSVTDFGIFVEVEEGIDGLVHVSELTWTGKVAHPGDLYKKGDEVDAVVQSVDVENQRMSLSIKALTRDPWQEVAEQYPAGSKLKGRVMRVVDFGAFVEVRPGIEGLVHVSELREERVERAIDVVKPGDEIEVQVLDVDADRRKMSLSVKALTAVPEEDVKQYVQQGSPKTTLGDVFGDKLKKQ